MRISQAKRFRYTKWFWTAMLPLTVLTPLGDSKKYISAISVIALMSAYGAEEKGAEANEKIDDD